MEKRQKIKLEKFKRRKHRTRVKIKGTAQRPRLSVFRSLKHIYAQIIDDEKGQTLVAASDRDLSAKFDKRETIAYETGKILAKRALEKKIKKIVFDRGGYKYHGRIKALAEGVREGGLEF